MKEARKYKQTELGLLPEGWEVAKLGDCLSIGNGKDYKHLKDGNIPVYGTGGIMCYVNDYLYDGTTVCIGRKGTIDAPIYHEGKIWTVDTLFYTHSFVGLIERYAYYLFNQINWQSHNEATGVPSLSKVNILSLEIARPPIEEQRRIASVLTSIDNLIDSLDRLIAKKRAIKQGAMQQLLSGKKRLKGFTEPWVEKKLGDIFDIKAGGDVVTSDFSPMKYGEYNYPIYSNSLDNSGLYGYTRTPRCPANSITITGRGTLGHAEYRNHEYDAVIRIIILIPKEMEVDCNCISSLINSQRPFIFESTGVPQLTVPQVLDSCIKLPSSLPEQQAIAAVLTSMDNELSALEAKRKKYEQIKQGMMQQLLTGRIRLLKAEVKTDTTSEKLL